MKKLLILSNSDAGLYKFRKELLETLCKNYEVYISLPNGVYISKLIELGCKYIDTTIDRRGNNLLTDCKLILRYIKIIRNIKPDVGLNIYYKT